MGSFTNITSRALDDGIFYQDYNELKDNIVAMKEFAKRLQLGGDPKRVYVNSAYALIEDPIYVEVDGTNLAGAVYELHFMGLVTTPDTGWVKLIRLDTLALVVEKSFTNVALDLVKSAAFTLVAGVTQYAIHVKATTGGVASPFKAYGFGLVQR